MGKLFLGVAYFGDQMVFWTGNGDQFRGRQNQPKYKTKNGRQHTLPVSDPSFSRANRNPAATLFRLKLLYPRNKTHAPVPYRAQDRQKFGTVTQTKT